MCKVFLSYKTIVLIISPLGYQLSENTEEFYDYEHTNICEKKKAYEPITHIYRCIVKQDSRKKSTADSFESQRQYYNG